MRGCASAYPECPGFDMNPSTRLQIDKRRFTRLRNVIFIRFNALAGVFKYLLAIFNIAIHLDRIPVIVRCTSTAQARLLRPSACCGSPNATTAEMPGLHRVRHMDPISVSSPM